MSKKKGPHIILVWLALPHTCPPPPPPQFLKSRTATENRTSKGSNQAS